MPATLRTLLAGLVLFPLLVGCVTEVIEPKPLARATLVVTKSENVATLQWQTQRGVTYAVMYSLGGGASNRWRPLPSAGQIRGDGGMAKLTDTAPPGEDRLYRLQVLTTPRR